MALTLKDLITENDDFDADELEFALDRPMQKQHLINDFGVDVIDWFKISFAHQMAVLFDKGDKRFGYYRDNDETTLVELDFDYQELADWGDSWDECPDVLKRDEDEDEDEDED